MKFNRIDAVKYLKSMGRKTGGNILDTAKNDEINCTSLRANSVVFATNGGIDKVIGSPMNDAILYFGNDGTSDLIRTGRFFCAGGKGNDIIGFNPFRPSSVLLDCVRVNDATSGASINGGDGDDEISGTTRRSSYLGYAAPTSFVPEADILMGGAGNDTIRGGDGFDQIAGGIGSDTFILDNSQEYPTIKDFSKGDGDRFIHNGAVIANLSASSSDTFAVDAANYHFNTSSRLLWYDSDGSQGSTPPIVLARILGDLPI